jgi:TolB protein
METMFWPWNFGPSTQAYRTDDLSNVDPLRHVRREGGISTYVHPVRFSGDPFDSEAGLNVLQPQIIADGVLGTVDAIEVACLVTDEIGAAAVWKRLLSIGVPTVLNAGTDAMSDFYRTIAIGASRIYVRPEGPMNYRSYLAALKAGRSFVTNGPLVQLRVGGVQPGEVLAAGDAEHSFTLELHSAVPAQSVSILVNGVTVWKGDGVSSSGSKRFTGSIRVPSAGWILAEVSGGKTERWPAMDSYAYAITSPIWIKAIGTTDSATSRAAARDLLRALDVGERNAERAYGGAIPPSLREHFGKARALLRARIEDG